MEGFTFKEPLNPRAFNVGDDPNGKPPTRLPLPNQSKLPKPGAVSCLKPKRKQSIDEYESNGLNIKKRKCDSNSSQNSVPDEPKTKVVLLKKPNISRRSTSKATKSTLVRPSSTIPQRPAAAKKPVATAQIKPTTRVTVPTAQSAKTYKPPLDMKSRLQIMEDKVLNQGEHNSNLQKEIELSNQRIANLEKLNIELDKTVKVKDCETSTAQVQIDDLQRKLRKVEEEKQDAVMQQRRQKDEMEYSMSVVRRQKEDLENDLKVTREKVTSLEITVATSASTRVLLEADLSAARVTLGQYETKMRNQDSTIDGLRADISRLDEELAESRKKLQNEETIRRMLHNTIQELKGNIRVFGRVRPLLGDELIGSDSNFPPHINFPDTDNRIIELEKVNPVSPNESVASVKKGGITGRHEFQFDRVFSPTSSQEEVFEEISQLVQSALDGYNVCIFAYGQTGSGKTFTMEGGDEEKDRGMICRAVEKIFSVIEDLKEKGWSYEVEVSFLEIYNETIRDLLNSNAREDTKHEIRLVGQNTNEVYVTNLVNSSVMDTDEVHDLLRMASENRSVAATKCNERSSRSHSVFRMKITGNNDVTKESRVGLLNLIDLAGSERLKDSGSQGARLRETQSINKSLANLSNVIISLANKEAHVPYRNSKLTHLLQNCLGGSSKMLMFVNVSPKEECFQETLNSLRFATQVNECNIGTAQKRMK